MSLEAFRTFADPLPDPLLLVRHADGVVLDANRATLRASGLTRDELIGHVLYELADDLPDELRHYFSLVGRSREPLPGALTLRGGVGHRTAWRVDANALAGIDGVLMLRLRPQQQARANFQVLTEKIEQLTREVGRRRLAEEHLRLLINELNHRVKNTLMTVQSICAQTLRSASVGNEVRGAIESRLMALSRSHNLLTRENWAGVDLEEVALEAMRPFRNHPEGLERFHIQGPPVRLRPRQALGLAMAFHELATNATKHGALLGDAGRVTLSWQLGREQLLLRWEEHGGPPVTSPTRKGFGSRLLEQGLASELDGEVRFTFAPGGVVCEIQASTTVLEPERRMPAEITP